MTYADMMYFALTNDDFVLKAVDYCATAGKLLAKLTQSIRRCRVRDALGGWDYELGRES